MNEDIFFNDIFFESDNFQMDSLTEPSHFLDVEDMLFNSPASTKEQKLENMSQQPIEEKNAEEESSQGPFKTKRIKKVDHKEKVPPESSYTKNVCFNICQKTIKVIKNGDYQEKVDEICGEFDYDPADFEYEIGKKKKDFTGPKALKNFIDSQTAESKIFSQFMKWFLEAKYLRYAINNGEMNNLKAYISYKNEVMLPILK